jgi:hypothetical protein
MWYLLGEASLEWSLSQLPRFFICVLRSGLCKLYGAVSVSSLSADLTDPLFSTWRSCRQLHGPCLSDHAGAILVPKYNWYWDQCRKDVALSPNGRPLFDGDFALAELFLLPDQLVSRCNEQKDLSYSRVDANECTQRVALRNDLDGPALL